MYRLSNPKLRAEEYRIQLERTALFPRDLLERTRGTSPTIAFSSRFDLFDDTNSWETLTSGTGTTTATRDTDGSFYTLTVNASTGRVVRQTRMSMPSSVGSARTTIISLVPFVSTFSATNYSVRAGCFDNAADKISGRTGGDGHFVQYAGGAWSIVRRSSAGAGGAQTDTVVSQASWNSDKLDGTGTSAYTLSATSPTAIVIEEGPTNAAGDCRVGFVIDGLTTWAHVFLPTGSRPAIKTQALPIRYEIQCTGAGVSASAASLHQMACACFVDIQPSFVRRFTRPTSVRVFSTETPVLAIRAQTQSNRSNLFISSVTVSTLSTTDANRVLVRQLTNPTLTGASFTAISASAFEVDVVSSALTGGSEYNNEYGCTISGTPDTIVVAARVLSGGATDCSVVIEWIEF